MEMEAMIREYLEYSMSRQRRKKILHSYDTVLHLKARI